MPTPRLKQSGFTLIEMLVIAPIVILAIGAFLTVIISMTGEVLSSRGSNSLAYDVQDTMNRIEQDVKLSNGFLAEGSITPSPGQGSSKFVNVGAGYGPTLILNMPVTNGNPLDTATGFVYLANQPSACNSPQITSNTPMSMNVVYFIKNDLNGVSSLWRRTIMQSDYATAGCTTPWQQPSCTPGYTESFCVTNDVKLAEGVNPGSLTISYYPSASTDIADATSVNTASSVPDRQAALQAATTVNVGLSATKDFGGRTVERSASLRATRLETNASSIAATPVQSNLSGAPTGVTPTSVSGSQIDLSWYPPNGVPTSYTVQYSRKSDYSSPVTISNLTTPSTSITGLIGTTGYFFKVSATNSFGTTSYSDAALGYTTGAHTWTNYPKLTGVGDWNKDGKNDIMGYKTNGDVDLMLGNGDGTFGGGIFFANIGTIVKSFIGPGTPPGATVPFLWWYDTGGGGYALKSDGQYGISGSTITSAAAGSFSSCIDVFAAPLQYTNNTTVIVVCRSTGLNRWSLNSAGVATFVATSGSGWNGFPVDSSVFGGGDFSQDGKGDIIVVPNTGAYTFYQGDGAGFVTTSTAYSAGWTNNRVTGGWDYNGDGKTDFLRYTTNTLLLYFYAGVGNGNINGGVVIN